MALRKIEINDNLLFRLGSDKSPKELGEIICKLVEIGMKCENLENNTIFLINQALETAKKINKENEVANSINEKLKELNIELIRNV